MKTFSSIPEFLTWRQTLSPALKTGFVPTMGALHAGHEKLIAQSKSENQVTLVSIFVNPLQFGPQEDFSRYPRDLTTDEEICRKNGVDAVLAPNEKFYAADHSTYCEVEGLDRHLCGARRQGHFRGVCTVVLKLLNLTRPSNVYFGQKDVQQAVILEKMIEDLSVPVRFRMVETVREESGLALSSRNRYLSEVDRTRAAAIFSGLTVALQAYQKGETHASVLRNAAQKKIEAAKPTQVEYVELVDRRSLQPVSLVEKPAVLAAAVHFGNTRLIDNVLLG